MNRLVKKIRNRFLRTFKKQIDFILLKTMKRNYTLCDMPQISEIARVEYDFREMSQYLDEVCPEVTQQFHFASLSALNTKYSFQSQNSINVNAQKNDGENWLIFIWKQIPDNYIFEFDYYPSNIICEFQLAFNYSNLYSRNRFLVLENHEVLFDLVKNGYFYPIIHRKQVENVFNIGKRNHVKLRVTKDFYEFSVNNKVMYAIKANIAITKGKDLALIFWEDKHNRAVECSVKNMKLYKISM